MIFRSTEDEFNPKPTNPCYVYHSLIDLLNHISSSFKRNFSNLQKKRTSRHPFERVPTPYQLHSWVSPNLEHNVDTLRAEDAFSSKLGYEEHIPGQTRDWNEELQTTRELPRTNLADRLLRERAIFKVHSDFVAAATRGSMAVVDGNVMAINPGEDPKMQMFIWNNIFFSLGFDVRDHYKEVGGDAAAHVAPRNDLQGVKVYSSVDLEGLFTLGTVVIDYRGFRVTAQSIIPGILEREQEQSVVYGSIDFGKTVVTHPKYMELLRKAGQQLKILPHKVLNDKNEEVELCSSIECKGIIGNDGRHYILDLLRTFPPDVNFLASKNIEISDACKKLNFPKAHKHKLATLRQELVDFFVENRYMQFLKYAAVTLQTLTTTSSKKAIEDNDNKQEDKNEESDNVLKEESTTEKNLSKENDTDKKSSCNNEDNKNEKKKDNTKEVVRIAARAVGSLKDTDFDVRFNPDVFSPGVNHANSDAEGLKRERQLVVDAADFLVTVQIPNLMRDFADHTSTPSDGSTLCEALHNRGINIRYLGKVTNLLAKIPELKYLHSVAVMELISRSMKHIFISYTQSVETIYLSSSVAHLLNCFLSSCPNPHPPIKNDELAAKKRKRRNTSSHVNSDWTTLTPKSLWSQLKSDLRNYFDWSLKGDNIDSLVEKIGLQKMSLLRSFCLKCGIQILLKDYNFNSKTVEAFRDDDILNLYPIVKHINPRASDAFNLYTAGQTKINQGIMREGYELISEALNLFNNVYGAMHPEIAQCLRMLARINYIMGEYMEAMAYQQKAVLMSERVNGIDSPHTITEYIHLALYCFANQQVSISLKLLYRARYLLLLIHGENHPELILIDSNIGLILHAVSQFSLSLQFLEKALQLSIIFYGSKSLKVGLSYHLVARAYSCTNDFRSALRHEKEAYSIYKEHFGVDHDKTKECDACLKHLTAQAVSMAKKINEVNTSNKTKTSMNFSPIQITAPSMISVLENLNAVNGILYIQITQAELDQVREELEKGHLKMLENEGKVKRLNEKNNAKDQESTKSKKGVRKSEKEPSPVLIKEESTEREIEIVNKEDDRSSTPSSASITEDAINEDIVLSKNEKADDNIKERQIIISNENDAIITVSNDSSAVNSVDNRDDSKFEKVDDDDDAVSR